jgi:hypothetical protein
VSRAVLLAVVLALVVISYFPFTWDPPRTVRNEVTRSSDGALRFGRMNDARTPGTPGWLRAARTSGMLSIRLRADPDPAGQHASIMMLASDFWHADFAIGQDGPDVDVWLRRPGSDAAGNPPFTAGGAVRPGQPVSVDVVLQSGHLRIDVNGTRLDERVPADSLRSWGPGRIALGDEVHGGGPWQGRIRLAEIRAPGYDVDYVRPGALSIPVRYLYLPDHFLPPPEGLGQWLTVVLDMLSFVPVGFLIVMARRPPVRPIPAGLLGAGLVVVLAAGKFLFHGRHTSVVIIVMEMAGAVLGALLAWRWHRANAVPSA